MPQRVMEAVDAMQKVEGKTVRQDPKRAKTFWGSPNRGQTAKKSLCSSFGSILDAEGCSQALGTLQRSSALAPGQSRALPANS